MMMMMMMMMMMNPQHPMKFEPLVEGWRRGGAQRLILSHKPLPPPFFDKINYLPKLGPQYLLKQRELQLGQPSFRNLRCVESPPPKKEHSTFDHKAWQRWDTSLQPRSSQLSNIFPSNQWWIWIHWEVDCSPTLCFPQKACNKRESQLVSQEV